MGIALIAHGGAGSWRPGTEEEAIEGMRRAAAAGREVLLKGGGALDAVCATVVLLECELDAKVEPAHELRPRRINRNAGDHTRGNMAARVRVQFLHRHMFVLRGSRR